MTDRICLSIDLTLVVRKSEGARNTVRTKDRVEFHVLAKKVAKLRLKAKISQRALSEQIGRDRSFINSFENGGIYPDFATILDILTALGADHGEVINEVVAEAAKKAR